MKLIIQVPCYNEAETLEIALNDLPKHIDGIDTIEYLIINDGSADNTVEVAKNWGVNLSLIHISEPTRLGMISYAVFCLKKKKKRSSIVKSSSRLRKRRCHPR